MSFSLDHLAIGGSSSVWLRLNLPETFSMVFIRGESCQFIKWMGSTRLLDHFGSWRAWPEPRGRTNFMHMRFPAILRTLRPARGKRKCAVSMRFFFHQTHSYILLLRRYEPTQRANQANSIFIRIESRARQSSGLSMTIIADSSFSFKFLSCVKEFTILIFFRSRCPCDVSDDLIDQIIVLIIR